MQLIHEAIMAVWLIITPLEQPADQPQPAQEQQHAMPEKGSHR